MNENIMTNNHDEDIMNLEWDFLQTKLATYSTTSHLLLVDFWQSDEELGVAVKPDKQSEARSDLHVRARVLNLHVVVNEVLVGKENVIVLQQQ